MTKICGNLRKMATAATTPVAYSLPLSDPPLPLNTSLGKTVRIEALGEIHCIACSRKTHKSFSQGYCYPCFRSLARCDLCIVKPELCHYAQGTCREPDWGLANCMQPHYVYLANSSGLKVGITRMSQIPTRWMDQGATQALIIFRVPSRHQAGLVEVALKKHISDRTDWRRMLTGESEAQNMHAKREELLTLCHAGLVKCAMTSAENTLTPPAEEEVQTFTYPILQYPTRIKAHNLDKKAVAEGTLLGIKGQYLILDTGVLNIRKFAGYYVAVSM